MDIIAFHFDSTKCACSSLKFLDFASQVKVKAARKLTFDNFVAAIDVIATKKVSVGGIFAIV